MEMMVATEDELSEAVVGRLVEASSNPWTVTVRMRQNGNGYLRVKLDGLIRTSAKVPVFLLTDLDRKACAPDLIREWLGSRSIPPGMIFRVAVREVEAWLLADKEGFSEFLGIAADRFTEDPENLADPKQELLKIVKRYGTRALKAELLPSPRSKAMVGLGYNATLTAFVRDSWDPYRAASRSDSLSRAIRRL